MSRKLFFLQCGKICQQTEWRREISRKVIRRQIPAVAANQWKIKTSETNVLKAMRNQHSQKAQQGTERYCKLHCFLELDSERSNKWKRKAIKASKRRRTPILLQSKWFSHKKCMKENKRLEFANHRSLKLANLKDIYTWLNPIFSMCYLRLEALMSVHCRQIKTNEGPETTGWSHHVMMNST